MNVIITVTGVLNYRQICCRPTKGHERWVLDEASNASSNPDEPKERNMVPVEHGIDSETDRGYNSLYRYKGQRVTVKGVLCTSYGRMGSQAPGIRPLEVTPA